MTDASQQQGGGPASGDILGQLNSALRRGEIALALGIVCILVVLILPMPGWLLDISLAISMTFSVLILMTVLFINRSLDFSSFPTVLLIATMLRLALNLASTRLILANGHTGPDAAGKVIEAFGSFVMSGNFVIGIIVFGILVIVNFVVITKGSGRIAEVSARFSLDAMPGKQMAIDADLSSGLIDEDEARTRRKTLEDESNFYGSMDGAAKFVRGDAIAGIIITLINIFGGLTIGVLQNGLSFAEAAQNYTLLTVGDGLVSQVPALVISTAAGIIVSRAGSESSLGRDITSQIMFHHRAIGIASAVLVGFSVVPGMPSLPFLILAVITAGIAYAIYKSTLTLPEEPLETEGPIEIEPTAERMETLPPLDILSLEVGYGLIPLVDLEQDGQLLNRIRTIRTQMAEDVGIIVPPIHIQDNMQLQPGEYRLLLKGNEIARGDLVLNHFLAMDPGDAVGKLDGVQTTEPTYGLPAVWIKEELREKAIADGFTVVDIATVMTTHTSDIIKRFAHELVGRQDVQRMLDHLKESYPKVVEELVPNLLPLGGVVKVLQNLLKEQVSIRDLLAILETLADWAPMTKDLDILTEYVRQSLARSIVRPYIGPSGTLVVVTLDQKIETAIAESIQRTDHGSFLAMDPRMVERIVQALSGHIEAFVNLNSQPAVLCSAQVRIHFKRMIDRLVPNLAVLSYDEVLNSAEVQTIGVVETN
ncbi:MAG: flagellar biosynthesis protein FlhA [Kiloniellales bacterium]|nr:flagellar biosynthesis protein FlhA [Kiloniellales bacterium]